MLAASRIPALALATAAVTVAVLGARLSSPEEVIGRSFASALERHVQRPAAATSAPAWSGFDPAYLHLSSHPVWPTPAVRLGDRISFSGNDGTVRSYLVVDVRPVPANSPSDRNGYARGPAMPRLLLVTANVVTSGVGPINEPPELVRFIVEAPAGAPAVPPTKPHAL